MVNKTMWVRRIGHMKETVIKIMDLISTINKSLVWIIGTIILVMSILLTVDVLLRYIFNSPTTWAFDLATWGTAIVGFSLGGYILLIDQHVRIDFFFENFSLRTRSAIDLISSLFLFIIAFSLIWFGTSYVTHYFQTGAEATGGLAMPLWIKWLIVPVGGFLLALQGLVKLIDDIYILVTGEKLYHAPEKGS